MTIVNKISEGSGPETFYTPPQSDSRETAPSQPQYVTPEVAAAEKRADAEKLIKEAKEKLETPKHDEISIVYEGAKNETKKEIAEALLTNAFSKAREAAIKGNSELEKKWAEGSLNLAFIQELEEGNKINFDAIRAKESPQIFFKQLYETIDRRGWFERRLDDVKTLNAKLRGEEYKPDQNKFKKQRTNQVQVIVSANNDKSDETKNTVLVVALEQDKGIINIDSLKDGLNFITSEAEFKNQAYNTTEVFEKSQDELKQEYIKGAMDSGKTEEEAQEEADEMDFTGFLKTRTVYTYNTVDASMLRGELAIHEYKEKYEKENGETFDQYWERIDTQIEGDPKYWRSEAHRGALMERLGEKYNIQLQEAQRRKEEIIKETVQKAKETQEKNLRIMESEPFGFLIKQLLDANNNPDLVKYLRNQILNQYNILPKRLDELIRRGTI